MALSGSQITGVGVTGFPGQAYAGFAAKAETAILNLTFGIFSKISASGAGVFSLVIDSGRGVLSSIDASHGVVSGINLQGSSVFSTINSDGQGVESEL